MLGAAGGDLCTPGSQPLVKASQEHCGTSTAVSSCRRRPPTDTIQVTCYRSQAAPEAPSHHGMLRIGPHILSEHNGSLASALLVQVTARTHIIQQIWGAVHDRHTTHLRVLSSANSARPCCAGRAEQNRTEQDRSCDVMETGSMRTIPRCTQHKRGQQTCTPSMA
jgi:hypothetical protein